MVSGVPIVQPERDQLENAYRAGLVELASSGPIEILRAAEALPVDPQAARIAAIEAATRLFASGSNMAYNATQMPTLVTDLAAKLLGWIEEA